MTHRKPVAYRSPIFRIRGATPPLFSSVDRSPARPAACHSPARSPAAAAAPPDLRPPRGLPARPPPAPRASLGASARSPARPARPRGSLQSVGLSRCFPLLSQASTPHAIQNSPSTRTSPVSQPYFTSGRSDGLECTAKHMGITRMRCDHA